MEETRLEELERRAARAYRVRIKTFVSIGQTAGLGALAVAFFDRVAKGQPLGLSQVVLAAFGIALLGVVLYLSPQGEP